MEKEKKECMVCFLSRGFVSLHILASDTDWMRLAGGWIGRSYSSFDFIRAFLFQWIFGLIFLCMSPYTVLCRWKAYFSKRSTSPIVVRLKFKAISWHDNCWCAWKYVWPRTPILETFFSYRRQAHHLTTLADGLHFVTPSQRKALLGRLYALQLDLTATYYARLCAETVNHPQLFGALCHHTKKARTRAN